MSDISNNITFVCAVSIDNDERVSNIRTIFRYYTKIFINSRFVFVTSDTQHPIWDELGVSSYETRHAIISHKNGDGFEKCKMYNKGVSKFNYKEVTDYLVFLDVDVIVDGIALRSIIQYTNINDDTVCHIGYNGTAIYLTKQGRSKFTEDINYEDLQQLLADNINTANIKTGTTTPDLEVGNLNAVGGCLLMTKASFYRCNGFNPLFVGWGYEDNEIISRCRQLKMNVTRNSFKSHYLFHLPHGNPAADKSSHRYYKVNENICRYVESLNQEQTERYITQW